MKILIFVFFLMSLFISVSSAQETDSREKEFVISGECTFTPKYIWRGITYTDGLAVQPSASLSIKQVTFQIWSNLVANDKNDTPGNEVDFYVFYNLEFGNLTLTPSVFYYTYPGQESSSTSELNLSGSYTAGDFTFGTTFSTDIKEASGYVFGYHDVGYSKNMNENLTLNLSAGFGWGTKKFNEYYLGLSKNALNYFLLGASVSYSLTQSVSVKPFIENYIITDNEIKELVDSNNFNIGISLGVEL